MSLNSSAAGTLKHRSPVSLAMLVLALLVAAAMSVPGVTAQTGQPTDPAAVVHAFNEALSRGDLPGALAFLDPACRKVVGPRSLNREEQTCGGGEGQFPGPQSGPPLQIAEANLRTTSPTTAEVDLTLSGGTLPPTPHPITLHASFTVENGRITRLLDELSVQTAQELAALAPPSEATPATMPNTGAGGLSGSSLLLLLSALCGLLGAAFRRTTLRSR